MLIDEEEEWREVPGFPGVMASSLGRVHRVSDDGLRGWGARSRPTYGSITATKSKSGGAPYARRYVRWRGWPGNLYVATLVCLAFHGARPSPKHVVMHLDDNSLLNDPGNLCWGTQRENLNTPTSRPRVDAARRANAQLRWLREGAQPAA